MLTFLVGCGFTFYMPAQQASINEFVSRDGAAARRRTGCRGVQRRARRRARRSRARSPRGSARAAHCWSSALFFTLMIAAVRRWKRRERPLPGVPERLLVGRSQRPALRLALAGDAGVDHSQPELQRLRERVLGAVAGDRARPARASAPEASACFPPASAPAPSSAPGRSRIS